MDIKQAYNKVRKLPNRNILVTCLDLGNKWAFEFTETPPETDNPLIGGWFDLVSKHTGKITGASPIDILDVLSKAKPIDIRQFNAEQPTTIPRKGFRRP